MNEILGAILLFASVLLGGGIVTGLQKYNSSKIIKTLLSFSGGFLLSIAFIHFIPEIYAEKEESVGFYILIGFLIQLFLEYFSGGIEHGHVHTRKDQSIPWVLFISLSIHSMLEGIPLVGQFHPELIHEVAHQHAHGHSHGGEHGENTLLFGIIFHKIPVAIALMTLLLTSGFSKMKSWLVLGAFALMAPVGMLLGHFIGESSFIDMDIILAIVVGMFLHISTTIIFESTENHKFNFIKLLSLMIGVILAVLIH